MRANLYKKQYELARIKLNEETWDETLDKWQTRADIGSLAATGAGLAAAATVVGAPVGAGLNIAASGVDVANALVSAARSIGSAVSGDYKKAALHAGMAALRGVGAIPILGDAVQVGRAVKAVSGAEKAVEVGRAATQAEKAAGTAVRSAPEAAEVAKTATIVAPPVRPSIPPVEPLKPSRRSPITPGRPDTSPEIPGTPRPSIPPVEPLKPVRRDPIIPGRPNRPLEEPVPTRQPTEIPGTPRPSIPPVEPLKPVRRNPIIPGRPDISPEIPPGSSKVTILPKPSPKLSPGIRTGLGLATGAAAGYGAKTAVDTLIGSGLPGDKPEKTPEDRRLGDLSYSSLGAFDAGDPSAYAKSVHHRESGQRENPFLPKWAIDPATREILRSKSETYESYNPDISLKSKVKVAVNNYLSSPAGYKLNKHLETLRNNLNTE